ncbi:hypothetical protein QE152_g40950, partial [Popillia japonica]
MSHSSNGPTIINDIFTILITIRQYKFLVTADVAKIYRQIWIHPKDRGLQKIVWRNNEDQEPQLYTLNTVTYGTSSASFLTMRCLQQVAYDNQHIFPEASQMMQYAYVNEPLSELPLGNSSIKTL